MIINLFRSKPTLRELIPDGFVDIHSHILPGIDDGAKNIDESLELISQMKNLGFSKIIGTPHTYLGVHNNTIKSIEESYNKLIKLDLLNDINVGFASEYMIDESLIKKAESNSLLTLKDRYVLVEMSFINPPNNLFEILFKLRLYNYTPIIAHPERYRFWFNSFDNFIKLKKMGCKFQTNMFSIIGYYGQDVLKFSDLLLKKNMIDFIGSDIHKINQIRLFEEKVQISRIEKIERIMNENRFFL